MLTPDEEHTLLGRGPRSLPLPAELNSKRVLVTGGGGSIGSALVAELLARGASEVIALDRDEQGLMRLDPAVRRIVGQLKGLPELSDLGPLDVVINAAALKDVCSLEAQAERAYEVNVQGALQAAHFAADRGASVFLQLSTDKAADPISVMGRTKRLAEIHLQQASASRSLRMVCLRLPNVLGSSGSVVPKFRTALREGKELPLRDPESTRIYVMLREAVAFLLHSLDLPSGVYASGLEEPAMPLSVLAERALELWGGGQEPGLRASGLGPGEKDHESLVGRYETQTLLSQVIARVSSTLAPSIEAARLREELGVRL